mmetsp:Transcript_14317/g.30724  ORF Transcript_14317/g.30724 Transcript_14317/m.30724 type:complete len:277 (+) Transcript_14317:2239-3069(+)
MLVNHPRPLVFSLTLLKGCKSCKHSCLTTFLRLQLYQSTLVHRPCQVYILCFMLCPLGKPKERPRRGIGIGVSFHDILPLLPMPASPLKPSVGHPGVIIGHPLHPPLKHRPTLGNIPHHLLHVHVFIPQEVYPGKQLNSPIQHIPRSIHKLISHLQLGIPQPQLGIANVHLQSTFKHTPRPFKLPIILFKPCILDPIPNMLTSIANIVFKSLPAIAEVRLVFFGIVDFDDGVEDVCFLAFGGFAEDLLGGDLNGCRSSVFYAGLVLGGHGDDRWIR